MRPLFRHVARPTLESLINASLANGKSRSTTFFPRPNVNTSACVQCQFRTQFRYYSENRSPSDREALFRSTQKDDSTPFHTDAAAATASTSAKSPSSESPGLKIPTSNLASSASSDALSAGYAAQSQPPRKDLPSEEEGRRWHFSKQFSHVMDNLQTNIFLAGKTLNDLTGYSGIEALKRDIETQEQQVRDARKAVHEAKDAYSAAIARRSASQREVNELLQRKHAWSAQDLERFTELYRSDHTNEQTELAAQQALTAAEQVAEEAAVQLSRSILARYHEEQIWSDKIRRMSTWGTWGLMGVNVLLFLIFQIGVEPWRRKRLVRGFEEKVMEALEREGGVVATAKAQPGLALNESNSSTASDIPNAAASNSTAGPVQAGEPIVLTDEAQSEPPTLGDGADIAQPAAGAAAISAADAATTKVFETTSQGPQEPPTLLHSIKDKAMVPVEYADRFLRDIFSQKEILLKKVDVTTIALEGAVAGVAFAGVIIMLLRPT